MGPVCVCAHAQTYMCTCALCMHTSLFVGTRAFLHVSAYAHVGMCSHMHVCLHVPCTQVLRAPPWSSVLGLLGQARRGQRSFAELQPSSCPCSMDWAGTPAHLRPDFSTSDSCPGQRLCAYLCAYGLGPLRTKSLKVAGSSSHFHKDSTPKMLFPCPEDNSHHLS